MTHGDIYLKDGVDRVTFMQAFRSWYFNIERMAEPVDMTIEDFLRAKVKPTLTEDEKVILRNIDKEYSAIGRRDGTPSIELYIKNENDDFKHCWCFYNDLFQFIQPRRRI